MSERVPIEILERHREYYNKQEGRKYPCSNQTVACGIFTSNRNKAINFMESYNFHGDKNIILKQEMRDTIIWYLSNGEKWIWTYWNETHRGYRFYKVAVDKDISPEVFWRLITPNASFYCCSFEII